MDVAAESLLAILFDCMAVVCNPATARSEIARNETAKSNSSNVKPF
jgi:hypothetical protein